jgi:hypothetical protein
MQFETALTLTFLSKSDSERQKGARLPQQLKVNVYHS